ncbi:hypothetical protein EG68_02134 [Paragonimus skrjabini miyazakii]|uniref:Methionine--tRNA ligase, cytoplasmic n=1 Tax=Paragonimus skrjabini miyazakii TaxID=59628 RepID=A0A8S9Z4L2_9TREM|nr:hypothetical protein EG68_02134 [Paragonimus skrjabini miyazakii]
MRVSFNPNCVDALKVVAAATLVPDVELTSDTNLNGLDSFPSVTITSQNAIVCRLLNTNPIQLLVCKFLLWESNILAPAVKKHIFDQLTGAESNQCYAEINSVLSELERRLDESKSIFRFDPPSACSVVVWSCLLPLFYPDSPFIVPGRDRLERVFKTLDDVLHSERVLQHFSSSSVDLKSLWSISLPIGSPVTSGNRKLQDVKESGSKLQKRKEKHEPKSNGLPNGTETTVRKGLHLLEDESNAATVISVSKDDLHQAAAYFQPLSTFVRPVYPCPKHPQPKSSGVRNVLITSALPYVNNVPHLGNMIGSTLSASVFALYCEVAGYNVLSICGTDEYGTATEAKALDEQLTPSQICDKYHRLHRNIYDWFDIRFDHFGRTTTEKHTEIVQDLFRQIWTNNFISEDKVEQLFCEQCSKFLADRFVEGVCPFCKYDDARGDQCDKCGRLMNAIELVRPRCKSCRHAPVIKSSRHLFLDLPRLEPKLTVFLEERIDDTSSLWTANARSISTSWLRDGLKARCITRDLKWGVPVPLDSYNNKVFYVWFDAPCGYISITAEYTDDWRRWWQPSGSPGKSNEDGPIELFQFMAKDNVPFHAIIFPACLLAANSGYTLVKHLLSTEYMNYEGTKFSKSRGIGVFGDGAMNSGIHSNVWRFYLLYRRPETQDSAFIWDDFVLVNNCELLNNLGNFINRALVFLSRFFDGKIPSMDDLQPNDVEFLAQVNHFIKSYTIHLEACRLREGLRDVLAIARLGNGYLQANQPWVTVKSEETKPRAGVVVGVAANVVCVLGLLLYPYMPSIGQHIWHEQCNLPMTALSLLPLRRQDYRLPQLLGRGHTIGKPVPLFCKIDTAEASRLSKLFSGGRTENGKSSSND